MSKEYIEKQIHNQPKWTFFFQNTCKVICPASKSYNRKIFFRKNGMVILATKNFKINEEKFFAG